MADSPLIIKSKEFALQIIKVCNYVQQMKKESVLTNQLIRSGTSVGANIREAFYGHGTADFIAKLQIALKECSESEYWLELLIESGYYDNNDILDKCIEEISGTNENWKDTTTSSTNTNPGRPFALCHSGSASMVFAVTFRYFAEVSGNSILNS